MLIIPRMLVLIDRHRMHSCRSTDARCQQDHGLHYTEGALEFLGPASTDLQQLPAEVVAMLLQCAHMAGSSCSNVQLALQVGDADGRDPDLVLAVPVLRFAAAERRLLQSHLRGT